MRKFYFSVLLGVLSAMAMPSMAQKIEPLSKVSNYGRVFMEGAKKTALPTTIDANRLKSLKESIPTSTTQRVGALVVLNQGHTASELEAAGFEVNSDLRSVCVVSTSVDEIESLASLSAVKTIDFGRPKKLFNNYAREAMGVDKIHSGEAEGLDRAYTGKGVVTGIYDVGVMANHANFLNEDGSQRIKELYYYFTDDNGDGYVRSFTSPEAVKTFSTDDTLNTHGTHTLGIMAGGYKGDVLAIDYDPNKSEVWTQLDNEPNIYYGMATESDIIVGCGELLDGFTIDGMTHAVNYAKDNGMPCVINYSAGATIGPHDGTDGFSQAITELAEDAVICVAAGNEADMKLYIECQGGSTTKTLFSRESGYTIGLIDLWSSDGNPFKVELITYGKSGIIGSRKETVVATCSAATSSVQNITYSGNTNFKTACSNSGSYMQYMSGVDGNNGRYEFLAQIVAVLKTSSVSADYNLGLRITPNAGQTVYGWWSGNAGEISSESYSGFTDGSYDNTISNESCAKGVISVGAYMARASWGNISGSGFSYKTGSGLGKDEICYFSSYGRDFDGEQLPHVVAPGFQVSSVSTPYFDNNQALIDAGDSNAYAADSLYSITAFVNNAGARSFWAKMAGTSMASPAVAGTVALWLEADPNLTRNEVLEIIANTSDSDSYTEGASDKVGFGKINALEGIKEVLRRQELQGIGSIKDLNDNSLLLTRNGKTLTVFVGGENGYEVQLYSVTGTMCRQLRASGDELSIDTSALSPGVYVVVVNTSRGRLTRKVVI